MPPRALPVMATHDFQTVVRHHPRYAYRPLPLVAHQNGSRLQSERFQAHPRLLSIVRARGCKVAPGTLPDITPAQAKAGGNAGSLPAISVTAFIPAGMAAMLGMSVAALLCDPLAGLQALYRRFGPSSTRQAAAGARFYAYPVRFEKRDLRQWKQPADSLATAIADTASALLSMHAPALFGEHLLAGVFLHDALRKQLVPAQLRAAVAAGLMKPDCLTAPEASGGLDAGGRQANWLAEILLCKYASAMARVDAPRHLVYGGIQWARRQLSIASYDSGQRDHWAVRDGGLLVGKRRYTGSTETLEQVALQYCHALGMLDLTGPAPERSMVVQAISFLREALAPGLALPAGPDGCPVLSPDWIARIDWRAFDAAAFLLKNGAQLSFDGTTSWWMTALLACFQPVVAAGRSPLDVRGMDGGKLQLFAFDLLRSQGYGDIGPDALSPFLLQALMHGFFRSVVVPAAAGPFHRALSQATRPMPFLRCSGVIGNSTEPGMPGILRSVASVKLELEKRFFAQDGMDCLAAVKRWALPVFCSIFLPALARQDLPDQMAYGGVDWTLLDIAASTIGEMHWSYRSEELLRFGWQMDVFGAWEGIGANANATRADIPRSSIFAIDAALRMAHSAGVIDVHARNIKNIKTGRAQLEKALALLQKHRAVAAGLSSPLDIVRAAVPRRIDTARALLTEYAIVDPDHQFTIASTLGGYLNIAVDTPMAWNTPHPLYKIFMEGGLQQLLVYGDVPDWQRPLLQNCRDQLSLYALNRRFDREFDAAIIKLSDTVLIPLMQQQILALPADQQRAWQCGHWNVRILRAQVEIRRPLPLLWNVQAINVDKITHRTQAMVASGAVLVELQEAGGDGDPQDTLHYWVSLKPFRFQRYDGDVAALLRENLQIFFKTDMPDHHLVKLGDYPNLHYYDAAVIEKNCDARGSVLALITQRLLAPVIAPLRKAAYGMTESEQFSQLVSEIFLNMLPFYSCISNLQSRDRIDSAGFFCVLDIAGAVPIVGAAGKTVSGVVRFGTGMSKRELKTLARVFFTRNLAQGEAHNSLSTVFATASLIRRLGKETVYFLDPGIRAVSSVANYARQLGRDGSRALMSRLRNTPGTRRIRMELKGIRRNRRWFFQKRGYWCAQPKKITWEGGERFLAFDKKRYSVMAIGADPNVIVLRRGQGVRLVDPRSGLCYGPLIRAEGARLRNSLQPAPGKFAPNRDTDAAPPSITPNCRVKRSPSAPLPVQGACRLMEAKHFGPGYYRFEPDSMGWTLTQSDTLDPLPSGDARLKTIDPTSAGYRSYRYEHNVLQESNFFVWGHRLWERRLDSSLHPTAWDVELPERLIGHTVHAMTDGNQVSLYIRVDFPVDQNEMRAAFRNIQIVPLGSYALVDRTRMCMAEIGGEFYTFKMSLLTRRPGVAVPLRKASAEQQDIYYTYCNINNTPIHTLMTGRLHRLRDCTPAIRVRIDLTLRRAADMIADAMAFIHSAPASVTHILRNFVPLRDVASATLLRIRIASDIEELTQTIAQLRQYKQAFLGFARIDKVNDNRVLAFSLRNSMRHEIDPGLINKPLIYIDLDEVMSRSIDMLAAYILHEATHTRLGTLDSMNPDALEQVYVRSLPNDNLDIADLMTAARETGNDPAVHAATLENLLLIFAYAYRGERSVANIFAGRSTVYWRKPD